MVDAPASGGLRRRSFGEGRSQSVLDRWGIWLSKRAVAAAAGDLTGKVIADLGCGYQAEFAMGYAAAASRIVLADVSLATEIKAHPKVIAREGGLPKSLEAQGTGTVDFVIANNILEHLAPAQLFMDECHRILAPGGTLFVNVPSWRGKAFLEFSAFTLGLSPAEEMNDHKMYYEPRDLWVLLVAAGFVPQNIAVRKHKFGLNVRAVARKGPPP